MLSYAGMRGRRSLQTQVKAFLKEAVKDDYTYSPLDPFVRFLSYEFSESASGVLVAVLDGPAEYRFAIQYHSEGEAWEVRLPEDPASALDSIDGGDPESEGEGEVVGDAVAFPSFFEEEEGEADEESVTPPTNLLDDCSTISIRTLDSLKMKLGGLGGPTRPLKAPISLSRYLALLLEAYLEATQSNAPLWRMHRQAEAAMPFSPSIAAFVDFGQVRDDKLYAFFLESWSRFLDSNYQPRRSNTGHMSDLRQCRASLLSEFQSAFIRSTPPPGMVVRPLGHFCWRVDLYVDYFLCENDAAPGCFPTTAPTAQDPEWAARGIRARRMRPGTHLWRFVADLARFCDGMEESTEGEVEARAAALVRRAKASPIKLEVLFPQKYPQSAAQSAPFIRVLSPRIQILGANDDITWGGCVLSARDQSPQKSFRAFLRKLTVRWMESGIRVLSPSLAEVYAERRRKTTASLQTPFSPADVSEADLHAHEAKLTYDDAIARVDFNRYYSMYDRMSLPTANDFVERLVAVPPVFHFTDSDQIESMEYSNLIHIPPTAAARIFQNGGDSVKLPLLFELKTAKAKMFCGLKEFKAGPGQAVIPFWMFGQLQIDQGDAIQIRCVELPQCSSIQFMPQDMQFFRVVQNQKTVLESALRSFFALSIGDCIPINVMGQLFSVYVVGLTANGAPANAVSIVANPSGFLECSVDVKPPKDFDPRKVSFGQGALPTPLGTPLHAQFDAIPEDPLTSPTIMPGREYTMCEHCGHRVIEHNYRRHLQHCQETYVRCKDCRKLIERADADEHAQKFHAIVACPLCQATMEKLKMSSHVRKECLNRPAHCQYLGCDVRFCDLQDHERTCGVRTEKCPKCGKFVFLKDKDVHAVDCYMGGTTDDAERMRAEHRQAMESIRSVSPDAAALAGISDISDADLQLARALERSMMDTGRASDARPTAEDPRRERQQGSGRSGSGVFGAIKSFFSGNSSSASAADVDDMIVPDIPEPPTRSIVRTPPPTSGLDCPYCSFPLAGKQQLIDHILSSHLQERKAVVCPLCRKREMDYVNHLMMTHL